MAVAGAAHNDCLVIQQGVGACKGMGREGGVRKSDVQQGQMAPEPLYHHCFF